MKRLLYGVGLFCVLSVGCAAETAEPDQPEVAEAHIEPSSCEPLRGVYRVTYAQKNGDCAELPVQLATFRDDTTMSALSSQCNGTVEISDNGCERTEDGDCDVLDQTGVSNGGAHLSSMFKQTSEIRIEGSTTISLHSLDGWSCTSEYALIGDKVRDE